MDRGLEGEDALRLHCPCSCLQGKIPTPCLQGYPAAQDQVPRPIQSAVAVAVEGQLGGGSYAVGHSDAVVGSCVKAGKGAGGTLGGNRAGADQGQGEGQREGQGYGQQEGCRHSYTQLCPIRASKLGSGSGLG